MAVTEGLAGRSFGMILLAIWLILTGLLPLLNVKLSTTITTGVGHSRNCGWRPYLNQTLGADQTRTSAMKPRIAGKNV